MQIKGMFVEKEKHVRELERREGVANKPGWRDLVLMLMNVDELRTLFRWVWLANGSQNHKNRNNIVLSLNVRRCELEPFLSRFLIISFAPKRSKVGEAGANMIFLPL